jgi:hypothetical protein
MPKLNAVLMVLLSGAVIGVLGWRVLGRADDGAAERARAAKILRKLADSDPDLRREAETEIKAMGVRGKEILRETAKGPDAKLAERAVAILKDLEPAPEPAAPEAVEQFLACTERYNVEFRNLGSEPIVIALEKKGEDPRFGWFEITDAAGRSHQVRPESYAPPVVEGDVHLVVLPPGAKQVLYAGWDPVSALLRELEGPCKVRFVYEASEGSPYRALVKVSAKGVPLKPGRYVSAPADAEQR